MWHSKYAGQNIYSKPAFTRGIICLFQVSNNRQEWKTYNMKMLPGHRIFKDEYLISHWSLSSFHVQSHGELSLAKLASKPDYVANFCLSATWWCFTFDSWPDTFLLFSGHAGLFLSFRFYKRSFRITSPPSTWLTKGRDSGSTSLTAVCVWRRRSSSQSPMTTKDNGHLTISYIYIYWGWH